MVTILRQKLYFPMITNSFGLSDCASSRCVGFARLLIGLLFMVQGCGTPDLPDNPPSTAMADATSPDETLPDGGSEPDIHEQSDAISDRRVAEAATDAGSLGEAETADSNAGATFTDPLGDLFDAEGQPISGEPYLDIVETNLSQLPDGKFVARMTLAGPLPEKLQVASDFFEWDLLISPSGEFGLSWPAVFNDVGMKYLLRLNLLGSGYFAEALNLTTQESKPIEYRRDGATVELTFSGESIGKASGFNYVIAVRKYGDQGSPSSLQKADKAPNEGHYEFPSGKQVIVQTGLPHSRLDTDHATVYFTQGNDEKAQWAGNAFEWGYATLQEMLDARSQQRFTLYLYATQKDLVQGLQEFSGFSSEAASQFSQSGAPRPLGYVMHVSPSFDWHGIVHEYTHTLNEQAGGDAYLSLKWLDEGLAETLAHASVSQSKYQPDEQTWEAAQRKLVQDAIKHGELYALADITTGEQWHALWGGESTALIYAESYLVTAFAADKYGVEACVSVFGLMKSGLSSTDAVQKAFGASVSQLEADFRTYLTQ